MVALITPGKSIRRAFNYNENKLKAGVAELLLAENYPAKAGELTVWTRLNMLLKTASLNTDTTVNCVHITLNFSPKDSLDTDKLNSIAQEYMEGIGFGNQPYLVYRHHDAGHPHLHLVTTNIEPDGHRIELRNIAIDKSEPARKAIEQKYGLIKAEEQGKVVQELKSAYTHKAEYGKSESKKAIGNVLNGVLNTYKYGSLPELNAVLGLYNVRADRGAENSRIYQHGGMVYRILDDDGRPVGVPIKASSFYNKPILKYLEQQFLRNDIERFKKKTNTRNTIDRVLGKHQGMPLSELVKHLQKQGVDMILRENNDGVVYGITYIDHTTQCVFNGSALGKNYSAKAILEQCEMNITGRQQPKHHPETPIQEIKTYEDQQHTTDKKADTIDINSGGKTVLEILTTAEETSGFVPYDLRKKKKKKRKGISK